MRRRRRGVQLSYAGGLAPGSSPRLRWPALVVGVVTKRIVLVDGFDDPYVTAVASDWGFAASDLGAELLVVGTRTETAGAFLRLSRTALALLSRGLVGAAAPLEADPEEVDLERGFRRALPGRRFSERRLAAELALWSREVACLIELARPDAVVVWNGLLHLRRRYALGVRAAGLPLLYAEKGPIGDTYYVDEDGVGPLSRLAEPADRNLPMEAVLEGAEGWPQPPRQDIGLLRMRHGLGPGRRGVLFVAQVAWDSNLLLFSPHVRSVEDAVRTCLAALPSDGHLLVKPHPMQGASLARLRPLLGQRGALMGPVHVRDALALSEAVVTVNSSVALQGALAGLPVVCLGRSVFERHGFVDTWSGRGLAGIAAALGLSRAERQRRQARAAAFVGQARRSCGELGCRADSGRVLREILQHARAREDERLPVRDLASLLRRAEARDPAVKVRRALSSVRAGFWRLRNRR